MSGERIFLDISTAWKNGLTITIPTDPRWIYIGNRNPSEEMLPEYLTIGADKWDDEESCDRVIMEIFPNRPTPL